MARDLVTGATGLLGINLVRALAARGRGVRILVRPSSRTSHLDDVPDLERVMGDVTDRESIVRACAGVERVYHCAAVVSMWPRLAAAMWQANVVGTEHVLAAVRRTGVARLVHCSTVDAIGLPEGDAPSTEETPWNWDRLGLDLPYPRTKYEAQRRVLAAAATDVDAVVVNPAYMFGPHDARPSSGRMILEVAAGRAFGYTTGGNNFVDVADVTDAMITAAERGRRGELYILGGANLSYREIFAEIAGIVGRRQPRLRVPYPLARLVGWIGDAAATCTGREPHVNSATARLGYVRHYYDPRKAITQLGLKQTPIRLAIERAVAWFCQAGMLPA